MTRIHARAIMIAGMVLIWAPVLLAILSSCEGTGPRNCPPPIGCGK